MSDRFVTANGLRFHLLSRGDGPRLALLLHGFPDDAGSMVPLMERLAARGYTAVAPYMRGYGRSGRAPDGDYQVAALARDALDLIEQLGHDRALLVGHDWGALAAYAAANLAPWRVELLVGLSVPPARLFLRNLRRSPAQLRRSWYVGLFQTPLAPYALKRRNYALVDRLWRDWSPVWAPPAERLAEVKRTFDYPGTVQAALAYYRQLRPGRPSRLGGYRESWRLSLKPFAVPTLLVAGEEDGCVGAEMFAQPWRACAERFRAETLAGVGHWVPLEAPDRVAELIAEELPDRARRRSPRRLPVLGT